MLLKRAGLMLNRSQSQEAGYCARTDSHSRTTTIFLGASSFRITNYLLGP
jgi:hypothetical protein